MRNKVGARQVFTKIIIPLNFTGVSKMPYTAVNWTEFYDEAYEKQCIWSFRKVMT